MKNPKTYLPSLKLTSAIGAALLAASLAPSAYGNFVLVDNFNTLTPGDINGQNGWSTVNFNSPSGTFDVVDTAPASPTDQALLNNATSRGARKSIGSVPSGSTGTLFFSVYFSSLTPDFSIGLSGDNPNAFSSYQTQMSVNNGNLFIRDGSTLPGSDNVSLQTDVWYDVWVVAHNETASSSGAWEAYIQGGTITDQTQIAAGGTDTFGFRNISGATSTFFISSGSGHSAGEDVFVNNAYFDNTGQNLVNPTIIPEPSTYALFATGSALLVCIIRRRRS